MRKITDRRAVALLLVLAVILIAVLLGNVVLRLITSQSRLTHHEVSRIQAFYADKAGVNYALEKLRTGAWKAGTDCTDASPCYHTFVPDTIKGVKKPAFKPASILPLQSGVTDPQVKIVIYAAQSANSSDPCYNPPGGSACVNVTANYTYTPQ